MSKIRSALVKSFIELFPTLNTAKNIQWENTKFEPKKDCKLWASFEYVEASRDPVTVGIGGEDEIRGYVQLDFNVPKDKGELQLLESIETVSDYYIAGRMPEHDGQTVFIRRTALTGIRYVDAWARRTATVYFYARKVRASL